MSGDRTAYDRGGLWSPRGRLYQVEYARQAVERGAPGVGVRTAEGVVLAGVQTTRSTLAVREREGKLYRVATHVGAVGAGHAADVRAIVEFARVRAQRERLRYGERADVRALGRALADRASEATRRGDARPYGATVLLGGVRDGDPALLRTDPGGTTTAWRAAAVGAAQDRLREHLEGAHEPGLALADGVDVALTALLEAPDDPPAATTLDVATVDERGFRRLRGDEVRARADALG